MAGAPAIPPPRLQKRWWPSKEVVAFKRGGGMAFKRGGGMAAAAATPRLQTHVPSRRVRVVRACGCARAFERSSACVRACAPAHPSVPVPVRLRLRALSPRTRPGVRPRPRQLDPPTLRGWMRLLRRVPDAVLWLLRLPSAAEERCAASRIVLRGIKPLRGIKG